MMKKRGRRSKAVAPVLATLLMIAVAVAMSVIIFMWSQGFLANTSTATGGQQGAQNQAAQSSIGIDDVQFTLGAAMDPPQTNGTATVFVRNVGAVAVKIGLVTATGSSSNAGFKVTTSEIDPLVEDLEKGEAAPIVIDDLKLLKSGDIVTIKITTTVGTFAQGTFTVP